MERGTDEQARSGCGNVNIVHRPDRMRYVVFATMVAGLMASFISGAEAAQCSSVTVPVEVTEAAGVQDLADSMNCTGKGGFDVTWYGSVMIAEVIEISSEKNVTITGFGSPPTSIIDGGNTTAIFLVSDGSTLTINNLVLAGGNSEGEGGAVSVLSSSSLYVIDCEFTSNRALTGGAMYAYASVINIGGNTSFHNNSAEQEDGGAIYTNSSNINIDGNTFFASNSAALDDGGATYVYNSTFNMSGTTNFNNNFAGDNAGAMYASESVINIGGITSFQYNSAEQDRGGAIFASSSNISMDGITSFEYNTAFQGSGGAVYLISKSSAHIDGDVYFANNTSLDAGGALRAYESTVSLVGNAVFINNSAEHGGAVGANNATVDISGITAFYHNSANVNGGAIHCSTAAVNIDGYTSFEYNIAQTDNGGAVYLISESSAHIDGDVYFTNNTSPDKGGALRAYESTVNLVGNTAFINNSAESGGAMNTYASTATINGTANFSSNEALNGGGLYSAQGSLVETPGIIRFEGNLAFADGGAMYFTDPDVFNISGVSFISNEAISGGAVLLASTEEATGDFYFCQFDDNKASYGGALYLNFGDGNVSVQKSSFSNNVAGELGGALFSAGNLNINTANFTGNAAGQDGLAIYNFGSSEITVDAIFDNNIFSCPSGEYSDVDDKDTSDSETCRFSLVCAHCLSGCDIPSTVEVDTETVPVCEPIPTGVEVSSTSVTLAELNISQGYYRVSDMSKNVLECYQPTACIGGTNALNYCADGYEGPYCAVCANGTAPGIMRRCHECSTATVRSGWCVLVLLVILVTCAVVSGAWHLLEDVNVENSSADDDKDNVRVPCHRILRNGRNILVKVFPVSSVRIVVVVLEIITQFTEIAGTVYPDEYETFISSLALSNVDIGFILASFCIVRTNFYDRLLFATVGPLVLLLALGSTYVVAKRRNRNSEGAVAIVKAKHLSTVLFGTFILYSSVSFTIFQTFVCDTLDDGGQYLRADFSVSCKTEEYKAYRLYAALMAGVYPFGIPVVFGWWLVRNRRDLKKSHRETMAQLKPFRGLWAAYRPRRYFYEIVEYSRRVMLTGAAVFVVPGSSTQIAVIVLLAVVFLFVSESLSPFESPSDMWLYRWGNGIILASMYVALLLSVELAEDGSRGTHAVTVLLISANAVMLLSVLVQAVLAVKGLCSPVVVEEVNHPLGRAPSANSVHPTDEEGLGCVMEASFIPVQTPGKV